MGVASFTSRPLSLSGKPPVHYWIRGCVFLTASMGSITGREISVPAGIEPRFVYRVVSNIGLVPSRPCNSGNRDNEVWLTHSHQGSRLSVARHFFLWADFDDVRKRHRTFVIIPKVLPNFQGPVSIFWLVLALTRHTDVFCCKIQFVPRREQEDW